MINRLYTLNEKVFNSIDTEEKAYWLGFILADGSLQIRKTGQAVLKLALAIEDKKHLEKFKKFINSNMPIKEYLVGNSLNSNKSKSCELTITSKIILEDLGKLGIGPRKSFTVEIPTIRKDLERHLLRGIWDGDGSVLISKKLKYPKNLYPTVQICGNKKVLNKINDIFLLQLSIKKSKLSKTASIFLFRKDGRNAKKIIEFLYKESKIHLDRKYKNAQFGINWIPKR